MSWFPYGLRVFLNLMDLVFVNVHVIYKKILNTGRSLHKLNIILTQQMFITKKKINKCLACTDCFNNGKRVKIDNYSKGQKLF